MALSGKMMMALRTCHEKNLQSMWPMTQEQLPHMKRLNLCKQSCRFMAAVSIKHRCQQDVPGPVLEDEVRMQFEAHKVG